jgi:ElaB/YqjD/DUF883 family membrane-anchored ribosome-binding protein
VAQDPNQIRNEIEETRERMSERVDAIGYKADVPSRTKEYVADKKDALVSKVSGSTPDGDDMKHRAQQAGGIVKENPLGLAVGAAAAGFLTGLLIPSTRVEDEQMGEMAEGVKHQAMEAGREAFERGKHVAGEAAHAATEAARETGRDEGEQLTESLKGRAQETAPR